MWSRKFEMEGGGGGGAVSRGECPLSERSAPGKRRRSGLEGAFGDAVAAAETVWGTAGDVDSSVVSLWGVLLS